MRAQCQQPLQDNKQGTVWPASSVVECQFSAILLYVTAVSHVCCLRQGSLLYVPLPKEDDAG